MSAKRNRDPTFVAGLLVVILGVGIFLAVAAAIQATSIQSLDEDWLRFLRADPPNPTESSRALNSARDLTTLGGLTVVIVIVASVCVFLVLERRLAVMIWLLAITAGGYGLSKLLKWLFQKPRPDVATHLVHAGGFSFPSGHTLLATVAYLTLGFLLARSCARRAHRVGAFAIAILLIGIVGSTRVYLGVHYPSDVLAGWAAGSAWAAVGWIVAARWGAIGICRQLDSEDTP